jgi:hypothetical protein
MGCKARGRGQTYTEPRHELPLIEGMHMSQPVFEGYFVIFSALGSSACIGVNGDSQLQLMPFNRNTNATTWILQPIPGSFGFYLEHQATGKCASFGASPLLAGTFDPNSGEFVLITDDVNDGLVTINNHDRTFLFDAAYSKTDAKVIPNQGNGGSNQKWRIVSTGVLDVPT